MKKLLFLAALLCASAGAYSQKIKLEKGTLDFLKSEKSFSAAFTYENMNVGKMKEADYIQKKTNEYNQKEAGKGDRWAEAWVNDRATRFEPKFIELFNKYMAEVSGPAIATDGKYLMTVNTYFSEPGFNVGVARKNSAVSVTCTFTNKETGEEMAVISVDNASANNFFGTDFDTGYRLQESYAKAGRELAQFLIKKMKL